MGAEIKRNLTEVASSPEHAAGAIAIGAAPRLEAIRSLGNSDGPSEPPVRPPISGNGNGDNPSQPIPNPFDAAAIETTSLWERERAKHAWVSHSELLQMRGVTEETTLNYLASFRLEHDMRKSAPYGKMTDAPLYRTLYGRKESGQAGIVVSDNPVAMSVGRETGTIMNYRNLERGFRRA